MDFHIDEQYLCSVSITNRYNIYDNIPHTDLTPEQLVDIVKGDNYITTDRHVDHPEFTKLRDELEELGYIKSERKWWNGDMALKPFTLNGFKFNKDENFPCAAAMGIAFTVARKLNIKTIY